MTFNSHRANRLKLERKRLKFKQAEIAELCGVTRETWGKYERGILAPGGNSLACISDYGADIQYILTGKRSHGYALTPDEENLINQFRNAPPNVKAAAVACLVAGSAPSTSVNVSGDGNRFAGRDFHENKK